MSDAVKTAILNALKTLIEPASGRDIVSAGLVSHVAVEKGQARILLELPAGASSKAAQALHDAVNEVTAGIDGVDKAHVMITAERGPKIEPHDHGSAAPRPAPQAGARAHGIALPGVKDIIAVASGKGGVGKSTVAVNLALALSGMGKKVGLLDADVYGPSIPRMLGLDGMPDGDGKSKLQPAEAFGLKVMSIGLIVESDAPMIWRGPMVAKAISDMLSDVDWGELDVLIVDMPPGTGDAQLTLAQRVPMSGAVVVSTPQEIALIDARKGLAMFQSTSVPVLGIVENMAWFETPGTGERTFIFGEGGAKRTAESLGVDFLGHIPIYPEIGTACDAGRPTVAASPESDAARPFQDIAAILCRKVQNLRRNPPKIVIV